jgi:hypothetical protein
MRRHAWMGAVLLALLAGRWAVAGDPACDEPGRPGFLQRVAPAGGWCPYGGFLCWWDRHCFPHCGGPDDYCRKRLPRVCWPPYPSYYIWGPPAAGHSCAPDVLGEPVLIQTPAGERPAKWEPGTP